MARASWPGRSHGPEASRREHDSHDARRRQRNPLTQRQARGDVWFSYLDDPPAEHAGGSFFLTTENPQQRETHASCRRGGDESLKDLVRPIASGEIFTPFDHERGAIDREVDDPINRGLGSRTPVRNRRRLQFDKPDRP